MLYSRPDIRVSQCTLNEPIHYRGVGPLSKREVNLSLLPAPAGSGRHILRRDVDITRGLITPEWRNVIETHPRTILGNEHGVGVSGVEPLLAALQGCGIDNVLIEIDASEMPAFDGSSAPLVTMINRAGIVAQGLARYGTWIEDLVAVRTGEQYALLKPSVMPAITLDMKRERGEKKWPAISLYLLDHVFECDIAPARNPAGGSPDDRLLYRSDSYGNALDQSRFADEALRYRALECLGLLALFEAPIFGHLYLYNPDSFLLHALLCELSEARECSRIMSYAKINHITGGFAGASWRQRDGTGGTGLADDADSR